MTGDPGALSVNVDPMPETKSLREQYWSRRPLFISMLSLFEPGKVVDLGAGHGGFSIHAADLGWEVTAVDARTERFKKDERITWVHQDVREHDLSGYDLICCLGLFYHLTFEDQMDFLRRAAGRPMIIDTHVDHGTHKHKLSGRVVEGDGYEGRYYREPGALTSSWGNKNSFWPTLETFQRMLEETGHGPVFPATPWVTGDRTFFLVLPPLVDNNQQPAWATRRSAAAGRRSPQALVEARRAVEDGAHKALGQAKRVARGVRRRVQQR